MGKDFKIYTKTGDDGTSGLFGGSRVKKYDLRLEAYGTVDELNAYLGLIRSFPQDKEVIDLIIFIQEKLFDIGAILASDKKGKQVTNSIECSEDDIKKLEEAIDLYEQNLPEIKNFILPGGNLLSGYCHVARTVCRRAERIIVQLSEDNPLSVSVIKFVNRLSDLLFVLSRKSIYDADLKETFWMSK